MFELSYGKSRPNVLHNTIRFEEEKLILNKWFCPAIKLYVVNFKSNFQEAADILWLNSINFLTLSFSLLCGHTEMMEFYFSSVVAMLGWGQQKIFYWKIKTFLGNSSIIFVPSSLLRSSGIIHFSQNILFNLCMSSSSVEQISNK